MKIPIFLQIPFFPAMAITILLSPTAQIKTLLFLLNVVILSTTTVIVCHRVCLFYFICTALHCLQLFHGSTDKMIFCILIFCQSDQLGQDDIFCIFLYQITVWSLVIWCIVVICWLFTDHLSKRKCFANLTYWCFGHSVFLIPWYCFVMNHLLT